MFTPCKFDWCPTLSGAPPDCTVYGINVVERVVVPAHDAQGGQSILFFLPFMKHGVLTVYKASPGSG